LVHGIERVGIGRGLLLDLVQQAVGVRVRSLQALMLLDEQEHTLFGFLLVHLGHASV